MGGRKEGTGFSISGNPCSCRCVCYVHLPCQPDCGTCASGFVPEKGAMIRWRKGERVAGKEIEEVKGGKHKPLERSELPTFRAILLLLSYIAAENAPPSKQTSILT